MSSFCPQTVTTDDIAASGRVIAIGTMLSVNQGVADAKLEEWNDIPPASTSYALSRESLKAHVVDLPQRLERSRQLH